MNKLINLVLALLVPLSVALPRHAHADADSPSNTIPAPITSAPKPSISLNPTHGYAGQAVTVSGNGVAAQPGVRVAWLFDEATFTAATTQKQTNGAYTTQVRVPSAAPAGAAKICAAATGTTNAAFECATFTVDDAPAGSVQGQLPAGAFAAANANAPEATTQIELQDPAGQGIKSADMQANGTFSISNVAAGWYKYVVKGSVKKPLASEFILVQPISVTQLVVGIYVPDPADPVTNQPCANANASTSSVSAKRTDETLTPFVLQQAKSPEFVVPTKFLEGLQVAGTRRDDFGTFVSGVTLNNAFSATLQVISGTVEKVQYHIRQPNGVILSVGESANAANRYEVAFNVGLINAGKATLLVSPVVGGVRQCPLKKPITVLANPLTTLFQNDRQMTWNDALRRYDFSGTLPNVPGLPLQFPSGGASIPYLGDVTSSAGAGIKVAGSLKLSEFGEITLLISYAQAKLLGKDIYNNSKELFKAPPSVPRVLKLSSANPSDSYVDIGDNTLYSFNKNWKVFEGTLATFWGVVTVKASVSVGLAGQVKLTGKIYPLKPATDLTLRTNVDPSLTLSIWIELLLGLASGGADAITTARVVLPLRLDTRNSFVPFFGDPCLGFKVDLKVWAKVLWKKWSVGSWNLFKYDSPTGCSGFLAQNLNAPEQPVLAPNLPRVLAAPSVAGASIGGRMVSCYVRDFSADESAPQPKVMVRFLNQTSQQWDAEMALTDGSKMVSDPVCALYGDGTPALVAWTQNEMTAAEENAAGEDLNAPIAKQEMYYARWNGSAFGANTRLTNDALGDGRPAIAGDSLGATLAWVKDTDGNFLTRSDQRIAWTDWNMNTNVFATPSLLNAAGNTPSMNAQVSVDRHVYDVIGLNAPEDIANSKTVLAWTNDADGNLDTASDRRMALAWRTTLAPTWVVTRPQNFPAKADSPSVSLDVNNGNAIRLAFTVREADGDGQDAGIGNNNSVWTGYLEEQGSNQFFVSAAAIKEKGLRVLGEKPQMKINKDGSEVLTLFRRFGEQGTTGQLGQLAMQQLRTSGFILVGSDGPAPTYLTSGALQNWQGAFAFNPTNGKAMLLNVQRPASTAAQQAQLQTQLAPLQTARMDSVQMTNDEDPIFASELTSLADPAIEKLELSQKHAQAGSTVVVSATVRNVGRGASQVAVKFYRGTLFSNTLLSTVNYNGLAGLGDSFIPTATMTVLNDGSNQPILVTVTPLNGGSDANVGNSLASASLKEMTAPEIRSLSESNLFDAALDIAVAPEDGEGVSGVRVFRSAGQGGAYELVGETTQPVFYDLLLQRGQTYCYKAQAYDASGLTSAFGAEQCAVMPNLTVFVPMVKR